MKYDVIVSDDTKKHIEFFRKTGQSILIKKIDNLLIELEIDPRTGTGHPEPLKYRPKC